MARPRKSHTTPLQQILKHESAIVFLVLYVNDILFSENDILTLQHVKTWLGSCFLMKDLGKSSFVLE